MKESSLYYNCPYKFNYGTCKRFANRNRTAPGQLCFHANRSRICISGYGAHLAVHPAGAAVFHEADEILGFPLSLQMWDQSDKYLKDNTIAQPAIVATTIAAHAVFQAEHPELKHVTPAFYIGHSLGELTALYLSGVLSGKDTLMIARERGRLMQQVTTATPGSMTVIGMKKNKPGVDTMYTQANEINTICNEEKVFVAAYNHPDQITISGLIDNIEAATKRLKKAGFRTHLLKNVPPGHTRYMEPVKQDLAAFIHANGIIFHDPHTPVIMCATGKDVDTGKEAELLFLQQLVMPVRFEQGINYARSHGIEKFIEFGPTKILASFIPQINPQSKSYTVYDMESAQIIHLSLVA